CDWLFVGGYSRARRGHAAAASSDEAVAATRDGGRPREAVRGGHGRMVAAVVDEITCAVGRDSVLIEEAELLPFQSDGLARLRQRPALVVFPASTAEVQSVVRVCHHHGVPFVARGHGTGLSGGALPVSDGVLIVLTRLNRILEVDEANQRITVEPGVINLDVS